MDEYPSFGGLADRLFWLLALLLVVVNAIIMKARAVADVRIHPERKVGYNRLIAGFVVLLGSFLAYPVFAIQSGRVRSVFELIAAPRSLAFWVAWIASGALLLWWVWFGGGLRTLASHPAIFNLPKSERGLRLFFGVMTLAFVSFAIGVLVSQPWALTK